MVRENPPKKRKRKSKAYRKACMIVNICFTVLIAFVIIWGLAHTFTKKNKYRDEGIAHYKAGEYEEAITYFKKALDKNQWFSEKVDVDIEFYLADSYLKIEDFSSAKKVYVRIMNSYSDKYYNEAEINYVISIMDYLILFSEGDYVAPLDGLKAAVNNGYTELSLYVAMCYENLGDTANMKKYYDIYNSSIGLNSYLALKYSQYYIDNEDYAQALGYTMQGISLEDKEYLKELQYLEIVCNSKLTNYAVAYDLSETYVSNYPDDESGKAINEYLYTRLNVNETPLSDKFDDYEDYAEPAE